MSVPIQATGHADLVEDGEGALVDGLPRHPAAGRLLLAPPGARDVPGAGALGRAGLAGRQRRQADRARHACARAAGSSRSPAPPVRDDFDAPALGPAWSFLRNPVRPSYSTTERRGWLTLHPTAVALDQEQGRLADLRRPAAGAAARPLSRRASTLRPGARAKRRGWCSTGRRTRATRSACAATGAGREVFVRQTVGSELSMVTASAPAPGSAPLILQIDAEPTRYTFSWAAVARHGDATPTAWRRSAPPRRAFSRRRSRADSSARSSASTPTRRPTTLRPHPPRSIGSTPNEAIEKPT